MIRTFLAFITLALLISACSPPASSGGAPSPVDIQTGVPAATVPVTGTTAPTAVPPTPTRSPAATGVPPTKTPAATALSPTGTPAPVASPLSFACSLAYTSGSKLYCPGEGGTPVLMATAEALINQPAISTDGSLIAYTVNRDDATTPLWVVKTDGSQPRLLAGPDQVTRGDPNVVTSPLVFQWQPGTHTLFFNTHYKLLSGSGGPGQTINSDLWSVDADSGTLKLVLPRQSAGRFALSPDGRTIALVLPQAIDLMDVDGSNRRHAMDFPAIMTYSEYAYFPAVTWSPDSSFFSVAILSPEPLGKDPSASLYRIDLDGKARVLGKLEGNFLMGQPSLTFSPDGTHLVYGRFNLNTQITALHLTKSDGSGDQEVAKEEGLTGLAWSPDSQHYLYTVLPSKGGFVLGLDGRSQPFAAGDEVVDAQWLDTTSFTYYAKVAGKWGLYFQRLGEKAQVEAEGLVEGAAFNVRPVASR